MIERVLFLGMGGVFSVPPLAALLAEDAGWSVVGVVVPRPTAADGPAAPPPVTAGDGPAENIMQLARRHDRPVYTIGRPAAATALLATLRPDVIVVACFPRLLPRPWLAFPPAGCLNLHPALLPAYRGPAPLFWQLQAGERRTGVTLHLLDDGVDSGDIVAQLPVALPSGAREATLDLLLARAGAQLLATALRQPTLPRRRQDSAAASRQPFPDSASREIPADWAVVRAYNFMRGMVRYGPFRLWGGDGVVWAADALRMAPTPGTAEPGTRWVTFRDGALLVRTAAEPAGGGKR